jgi:hypothetical protein
MDRQFNFKEWAEECGVPLFRRGYITSACKDPGYFDEEMAATIREHGGFGNGHIAGWPDLESAKSCMVALGRPCPDEAPVSVVLPRNFKVGAIWKQSTSKLVVGPGWIAYDSGPSYAADRLSALAPLDGPGLASPFMFGAAFGDMLKPDSFRVHVAHVSWDNAVFIERTKKGPRQGHTFLVAGFDETAMKEWADRFPMDLPWFPWSAGEHAEAA